jgi:hypothetical protein
MSRSTSGEVGQGDGEADGDRGEAAMDFLFVVFGGEEQHGTGLGLYPSHGRPPATAAPSCSMRVVLPSPPSPATMEDAI